MPSIKISKKVIYGCESRGDANSPYLIRYTLFERSFFQICLHVFIRSDADDLHDHPWDFLSIVLWRGYNEVTIGQCKECEHDRVRVKKRKWPGMFLYRKAKHRHRVELINEKRAVTLVFMGRRVREWGFWTADGWIKWTKYFIKNRC